MKLIFNITLAILLALVCQFLVVFGEINFSEFGVFNWILETIYLLCAITFSIYLEKN